MVTPKTAVVTMVTAVVTMTTALLTMVTAMVTMVTTYPITTSYPTLSLLETEEEALAVCMKLHDKFPRSEAVTVCTLNLCSGEPFRAFVDKYMQRQLRKGVPPLFNILKHQFAFPEKVSGSFI